MRGFDGATRLQARGRLALVARTEGGGDPLGVEIENALNRRAVPMGEVFEVDKASLVLARSAGRVISLASAKSTPFAQYSSIKYLCKLRNRAKCKARFR